MALLRKRRRFRAGPPEAAGLLLLTIMVALGAHWAVYEHRAKTFHRTHGRILQVLLDGTAAPRLLFTYRVNGVLYSNVTEAVLEPGALAEVLPAPIMAKLNERGIFDFGDVPEEIRRQIREGTNHTFDELNIADRRALERRGYDNAEELRYALLRAMDGGTISTEALSESERLDVDVSVAVLYDPEDPSMSTMTGRNGVAPRAFPTTRALFWTATAATGAYFAVLYPRWKRRRT